MNDFILPNSSECDRPQAEQERLFEETSDSIIEENLEALKELAK
jgi:hypothetical protein